MMSELGMDSDDPSAKPGASPAAAPAQSPPMEPGRKGDEPVKNNAGCPGGNAGNTNVQPEPTKLSAIEGENRDLKIRLSRIEVERHLEKLNAPEVKADDVALVSDLIALPPDIRSRMIERMTKLSRPSAPRTPGLDAATAAASGAPADGGKKRLGQLSADEARSEKERLTKLARAKGETFESVARAEGYDF
jgi:hypothetical protein